MNKTYTSKWNAALGAWVACSEITRRAGKTIATVLLVTAATSGAAWATNVTCTPDVNGSYLVGDVGGVYGNACNQVPATTGNPTVMGTNAGWYVLARSNLDTSSDQVQIGDADISYGGPNGFGVIGNQYLTHGSLNFNNVTAKLTNTGGGGGMNGLGTHSTLAINGVNFNLTSSATYTGGNSSGTVGSYGILAGSSVISGEGDPANNGKFSTITLTGTTVINQTTSGGAAKTPILNSGLRAIQGAPNDAGNGSSGKIDIQGTLNMALTGDRIEGIYVSGAASDATSGVEAVSQVILNNSNITLTRGTSTTASDSSAIKIGKTREVGTGKGLVVSNGALSINMGSTLGGTQPYMSSAIKMAVSGSQLLADGPNSSANINAVRSALAIGIDDWGSNVDSTGIQALLGKATVTTQSTTAPLVLVDSGQQNARVLFDNQSLLTAASNGYLIDIIKYRTSTTASSVQFDMNNGTTANGLTNQTYATSALNVGLNNASTWNLREKSNGDKTATYTTASMTAGSTLNAFKAGAAAFVMNGPLSSDASTINLVDGETNDVLTVQPSYTGSNGAILAVDTCLAASGAPSDVLKVVGNTSGTTVIKVTPSTAAPCTGADTTTTGDGKGILVVQVTGSSDAVFTLAGGTITQGNFTYHLVKVGTDWYLQSQALPVNGTVVVQKVVDVSSGAPPFSGTIPFTLTCTNPTLNQPGTITVSNNAGSSDPVTVPAGSSCSVTEGSTIPAAPTGYAWDTAAPIITPASASITAGGTQQYTITNKLVKQPVGPSGGGGPAQVPANSPWALGGLAVLLGLAVARRQRKERRDQASTIKD